MTQPLQICIGVLALQGSFQEHVARFKKLPGVSAVEVRTKKQLEDVDGLVIPGGESTTMALIAERFGLISDLRDYLSKDRPVWGTCAGLIFLANRATGQKAGGQALLGGLDVLVSRNFFGAQIHSFEALLPAPACLRSLPSDLAATSDASVPIARGSSAGADQQDYRAVFIRAPAIMEAGPTVEILSEYVLSPSEKESQGRDKVAVAARSKNLLATAFHPELTDDLRWHAFFASCVRKARASGGQQRHSQDANGRQSADAPSRPIDVGRASSWNSRPRDLPVFGSPSN